MLIGGAGRRGCAKKHVGMGDGEMCVCVCVCVWHNSNGQAAARSSSSSRHLHPSWVFHHVHPRVRVTRPPRLTACCWHGRNAATAGKSACERRGRRCKQAFIHDTCATFV
jgi:hypothetical protein